jgi:uroporphyrinogen decarboxylase
MSGKTGSLISPDMICDFMLPNYRKISQFAKEKGIQAVAVDTDGKCAELVPLFMDCGINMLMPFEVAAGNDIIQYRALYPELIIMGGIDKIEVSRGREAIDRELERIRPIFEQSRYFAMLDHLIHPQISWQDFLYFTERLKIMIGV